MGALVLYVHVQPFDHLGQLLAMNRTSTKGQSSLSHLRPAECTLARASVEDLDGVVV